MSYFSRLRAAASGSPKEGPAAALEPGKSSKVEPLEQDTTVFVDAPSPAPHSALAATEPKPRATEPPYVEASDSPPSGLASMSQPEQIKGMGVPSSKRSASMPVPINENVERGQGRATAPTSSTPKSVTTLSTPNEQVAAIQRSVAVPIEGQDAPPGPSKVHENADEILKAAPSDLIRGEDWSLVIESLSITVEAPLPAPPSMAPPTSKLAPRPRPEHQSPRPSARSWMLRHRLES
jgi:hypothetical protein